MNLELMGRNFFDPHAGIKLEQQRLELWCGVVWVGDTILKANQKSKKKVGTNWML